MKHRRDKNSGVRLRPRRLKSVKSVMWGYFCILTFFVVLLIELVFYFIVVGTYEDRARSTVDKANTEVVKILEADDYMKTNPGFLDRILKNYRREGVEVCIISLDGNVISPADIPSEQIAGIFSEITVRLEGTECGVSKIYRTGDNLNSVTKTEFFNGSYIFVTYSMTVIRSTIRNLQLYLVLVGAIFLVLAFLVSYMLSQRLTRGLKNMSVTATSLAKGDYGVQFTNADYTELAQLSDTLNYVRDEIKKTEDFQHEILANVTHDLKTPLTMIKAYASMIKEISGDNPQKREQHLQVIIDEADRLTGLVNDVLSVSKLRANMDTVNLKVINLTELVYGVIDKFGYLQERSGYKFMIDIENGLYTRADEEKIKQVIYNLLGNAANYTGEDKTVFISLKSNFDGDRIKFSVRDTGKGISPEELPEIWNRYYRVKENHTRPVKGTGLGLNIVKVILENHYFDFGVESSVGEGSTFWVDFPAVSTEA